MHVEKKMLVLPVLIMMALSITGISVSHWSDSIQIEGTVNMASITLVFDNSEAPICAEFHDGAAYPGELCGKDVAETTVELENLITDPHNGKSGYGVAVMTIENAYPCYRVHWLNPIFHNIGGVGVKIVGFDISDPTGVLTWNPAENALEDNESNPVITVVPAHFGTLPTPNIAPCTTLKIGEFDIHIEQDAKECHTYEFLIKIFYEQCTE